MLLAASAWSNAALASERLNLDVRDARASFDTANRPVVNFRLSPKSGKEFGVWTARHVGRSINLYVGDRVVSNPRLMSPITGGTGQLSMTSTREAVELAVQLRDGSASLSVEVKD